MKKRQNKFLYSLIVLFFLLTSIEAESLIDTSKNLVSSENPLIDKSKNLVDESKSLINKERNLIDEGNSLVDESKNLIKSDVDGIGSYTFVVQNVNADVYQSSITNTVQKVIKDSYVNGYGEFLEVVTSIDPLASKKFVSYLSDWQWSDQTDDFYSYSANRAEQEKQMQFCYERAIAKFGIGTAIIATTWVVAFVVPGGTVYQAAVLIIAKSTTVGAFSGGGIGGIMSCGIAYLQGKRGEELICDTLKGAADGYLVGAITGFAEGSAKVAKLAYKAKKMKDVSGLETIFDGKVYDETGKLIGKYDKKWYVSEKAVRDAEKRGIENLSVAEKGNYGEIKMDLYMRDKGYVRISKNQVTNLTDKGPQGIDGVYYNPNGKPPYVIAEAKCGYQNSAGNFIGKNALSNPADGIEMSENWLFGKVTGNNRLEEAVGKKLADDIDLNGFEKIIVHVDKEGNCTPYLLDNLKNDVNIVGKW